MEGLRRMFYFRDSIRGIKLPVVIVIVVAQIYLIPLLLWQIKPGGYGSPFLTMFVIGTAIWTAVALLLNWLRRDPYYSFELVPTYLMVNLASGVILFLVVENRPEVFGGLEMGMPSFSTGASLLSFPVLLGVIFYSYLISGIGSAIALLFSGSSTGVGTWARGVVDDFKGLTESDRESQVPRAEISSMPSPSPPSAPSTPSLDAGQIAARNAWQAATGSNYIYCRGCGEKSAIWDFADFCSRCGQVRGIPTTEVECIEKCGARIGKGDKFCFRCGAKQPV